MDTSIKNPAGKAFWAAAIIFLLWNIFGCAIYLMDQTMSDAAVLEAYGDKGEAMLAAKAVYPIWAVSAYAVAVWGGLLAAIFLLLRKKLAVPLFSVSLIAAIICFIPTFTNSVMKAAGGDSYWVMPVVVIVLGIIEVFWSRRKVAEGLLS